MIEIKDKAKCCGCHACMSICPVNAIEMKEDEYGFKYPSVDKSKCINCGLCEKKCPILNTKKINNEPKAFACFNNNEKVRLESSSGGIFTLLAEYILDNGGYVFGAAFDKDFLVKHIKIDSKKDIKKLRTSKYLQSEIGDTYKECKKVLNDGKLVLFTGTPCQIEGLLTYLDKDYDNLYTQDIICHGVPSPKVWKHYLNFRKLKDGEKPKNINFRNKDNGWKLFNLKFDYKSKCYVKSQKEDIYIKAFLQNIDLRDSCYECSFKKKNRVSDITLADFWGVQNVMQEMDDNKGTSLVIINSNKGSFLMEKVKNNIKIKDIEFDVIAKTNSAFIKSVSMHKKRDEFMKEINDENFDKVVKKYVKDPSIFSKITRKSKRIVKKVLKK